MKINKNNIPLILIICYITILFKILMYSSLPEKYFFDARYILNLMNGISLADSAYMFTAKIFNLINIFNFQTLEQWGYLITLIFMPIIITIIIKNKRYNFYQSCFIIASIVLLNIYVLCLSKDIIQFVYFMFIYFILSNKKLTNTKKVIFIDAVLMLEALSFRIYYAIMALIMTTIYFIYIKFIKDKKINKKQIKKFLFLSLLLFFMEIFVVQFVKYDNYESILNARYSVNIWRVDSPNANTIINELLGQNNNFFTFVGNYMINMIRMLFPIELIAKGPKQIIFAVYQIYISLNIIKALSRINYKNCLWIICTISFIMISVIFEPDFGSFVRHEAAFLLILITIIRENSYNENNKVGGILNGKN